MQIALGTAILLSGVLALSWRLHDDTIPPAKSKAAGALTPGLGVEESLLASPDDDNDITSSTNISSSPVRRKTDNDKILSIARRRQALSEAEEIWGELQDEDAIRASLRSTGVRSATILEEGTDGSGGRPTERTSLLSKAPGRRKSGPSRRVTSYGFPKVTSARSLSRQRSLAQGATGGWWKMRWWKRPHREGSDMA